MADRFEVAMRITYLALYVGVCVGVLLAVSPGLRGRLQHATRQQVYAWRRGMWEARRAPAPEWTTLLERADLPSEPAA